MSAEVIAVVGPTGSGKSELAVKLCQRLGGEVVSADSVQIYRRFDIGSAKLPLAERGGVAHHLIDELDPLDAADAARFVQLAEQRMEDIISRGKRPVICGGTFLWVRALIYGLAAAPAGDASIRARHRAEAETLGRQHLHARLEAIDPQSHRRLSPNDFVRVSRALEVYELTGRPLSELQAQHGFQKPRYPVKLVGLRHSRPDLNQRLHERVVRMFERGWLEEVRALRAAGLAGARALSSVGYRQVAAALETGTVDMPELIESVARATRIFVRRQLTWLRDEPVHWLEPHETESFTP